MCAAPQHCCCRLLHSVLTLGTPGESKVPNSVAPMTLALLPMCCCRLLLGTLGQSEEVAGMRQWTVTQQQSMLQQAALVLQEVVTLAPQASTCPHKLKFA